MRAPTPLAACLFPTCLLPTCLLAAGCVTPETTATTCADIALAQPLLVLEGDLRTTSGLGRVDAEGCLTEVAGGLALGSDTWLAVSGGQAYVLDRTEALAHRIDPASLEILESVRAQEDGEGGRPNPQDIAVDEAGRRWVTRFDQPLVLVFGPDGSIERRIDLAPYADADGNPEASAIRVVDGVAHVALEKLDALAEGSIYPPTGPGAVLAIPTDPAASIQAIDLAGQNPFGRFAAAPWDPRLLAVATPGEFGAITPGDGIDLIDTASGQARQIISEEALGGSATEVALVGPNEAYAIVAGTEPGVNPTRVVAFDPERGAVTRALGEAAGFYHWGLVAVGDHVAVGDRTPGAARIAFFARSTGAEVASIPAQRLAPLSMLLAP